MSSELKVIINGDASGAVNALSVVSQSVGGLSNIITTGLGVALGNVLVPALGGLKDTFASFITEAMGAQEGLAQMNAVLKSTGGAAGLTANQLLELATQLSGVTRYSDDAITAGENLLLTFTNVGKDVFPDATKVMLDMSTAMGTDVKSSAIQLGKALNDPKEGLSALTRVGVTFTDEQKRLIESLQKSGDVAGAQRVILAELQREFGGSAEAAGQTLAGQLDVLRNNFDNLKESIGTALLPILQSLTSRFSTLVSDVAANVEKYLPVVRLAFENLIPHVEGLARALGGVLGIDFSGFDLSSIIQNLVVWFGLAMTNAGQFLDWLSVQLPNAASQAQTMFQPLLDAIGGLVSAFIDSLPQMQETGAGMVKTLNDVFAAVSPEIVANIAGAIQSLTNIWQTHGDTILTVVKVAWDGIVLTIGGALVLASGAIQSGLILISGLMDTFSQLLQGNWRGAWDKLVLAVSMAALSMLDAINVFFESVANALGTNMDEIRMTWTANWNMAVIIVTQVWQNIKDAVAAKVMEMTSGIQSGIINIINWLRGIVPTFIDIGTAWFAGITQGILLKVTQLQDAVVGSIKSTIAKAREALGIASPSRVFAEIGEQMMAGMAVGLADGVDMPKAAIAANTTSLAQSVVMGGGGSSAGNQPLTINISHYIDGQAVGRTTVDGTLKALAERGVDVNAMLAAGT
uniref:Bacteriophage tail tape measure N-terminal domain-containing protein n=1 Tax=Hot spring virus BHS1 TaxID=2024351 RepID=A0A2U7NW15_9VIRU|nr:hypothetical protein [Hot spring virus BHS1]